MKLRSATDHLALVTDDTAATVDFYSRVVGWPLVAAQRGTKGDGRGSLITAFRGDGWILEFEEVEGREAPQPQVSGFPHIGLDVKTPREYERWKAHLQTCAVEFLEVREHDCWFSDPNGLWFQLIVKDESRRFQADDAASARQLVDQWLERRSR